ncbi:MAG TPA: hypothetical protein VGB82_24110 [Alphaproteobacteria bacterium]
MDQKFIRRAAQVREAAKWVSDHAIQVQMLEAALFYDHLAMTGVDGAAEPDRSATIDDSLKPF